ncbi:MAG: holo-ACP synthase [Parachlamydiaceae bacterium]
MIEGIGTDIIEIERIEQSILRYGQRFLDRVFTLKEQAYCTRHRDAQSHFAGRFAAKEAIVKAIGSGFGESISWLDIEIVNDVRGKPTVILSPALGNLVGPTHIDISISHCREYAVAFAVRTPV